MLPERISRYVVKRILRSSRRKSYGVLGGRLDARPAEQQVQVVGRLLDRPARRTRVAPGMAGARQMERRPQVAYTVISFLRLVTRSPIMTGADLLVRQLKAHAVPFVPTLCGNGLDRFYVACKRYGASRKCQSLLRQNSSNPCLAKLRAQHAHTLAGSLLLVC
jgi:hypothetical protein